MLPSKEKFQYYNCPFYAYDGSCDRPFCHFKHSDHIEVEKEGSQEPPDSEEDCPSSCVCHSQQSLKKHTVSTQKNAAEIKENGTAVVVSSQLPVFDTRSGSVPQYRPTPIVELQKRSSTMESSNNNPNELYSPTAGFSTSGALTYSPSDRLMLEIKQECMEDTDTASSNSTLDLPVPQYNWLKKEEEEEEEAVSKIKVEPSFEWTENTEHCADIPQGPVKIEYFPWQVIPIDPPSSPSVDDTSIKNEPLDCEASLAVSVNVLAKEEPAEYSPCTSKRLPTSLEYNPSINFGSSIKKIKLQYDPCNHRTAGTIANAPSNSSLDMLQWASEASTSNTEASPATTNLASYVPTDKSKLSGTSKSTEVKTSHSSTSKKHKHKRSRSSHSSSSKKRHRTESTESVKRDDGGSKKHRTESTEPVKKDDGGSKKHRTESTEPVKKDDGGSKKHRTESTESVKKDEAKSKKHRTESTEPIKKVEAKNKKHSTEKAKKDETNTGKYRTDSTDAFKKDETKIKEHSLHSTDSVRKDGSKIKKSSNDSKSSGSSKSHSHSNSKSRRSSSNDKSKDKEREKHRNHKKSTSKDKSHKSSSNSKQSSRSTSNSSKKTKDSAKENVTICPVSNDSPLRDASPAASDSEHSQDSLTEECYHIFEQYHFDNILAETMKPEAENLTPSSTDDNAEMETVPSGGKKRVAYSGATQTSSKPKLCRVIRPVSKSAGLMMAERWKQQQTELLKTNTGVNKLLTDLTGQPPTAPSTATSTKEDVPQKTSAQSFGKGKPRVAHKVKEELLQRPIVDASAGDRIPFPRRQHVLDKFTDACLKKFATTEEAFEKAIELELACFVKSLSIPVYNNLFVSNMLKLKHSSEKKEEIQTNSHQQLELSLDHSIVKKKVVSRDYNFRGVELYKRLTRYILSEELLKRYSYPMLPENEAERGKAVVYNVDKNRLAAHNGLQRDCTRCQALFYVDKNGMPKELSKDELCIFHPKRAFPKRVRGCIECYFACCDLPIGAEGCETCKYHICDKLDLSKLHGFVQTFEKDVAAQASGVYALDCEMCLTTEGTELTRITVIDDNSSVVYDTLVKPDKPILDYCTRYSGVDEAMLKNVTCSLRDVQSVLLNLFSKDTILIGHSLNSDLMVLKLIHYNVVDTSIVYPHREGPPKRRALKNVAKDHLFRLIQQEESGHDSKEDAVACMDLMKLKVKEAAKLE